MIRDARNELNLDHGTLKDFRHTLMHKLYKNKVEIEKIQTLLGYFGLYFSLLHFERTEMNQSA